VFNERRGEWVTAWSEPGGRIARQSLNVVHSRGRGVLTRLGEGGRDKKKDSRKLKPAPMGASVIRRGKPPWGKKKKKRKRGGGGVTGKYRCCERKSLN